MKINFFIVVLTLFLIAGCSKKVEPVKETEDPHSARVKSMRIAPMEGTAAGVLDLDTMLAVLPEGWTRTEPTGAMRMAQINIGPVKGDTIPAELAVFHFPGTGGSAKSNIQRWHGQLKGPHGEPGGQVAKTDTMMVGLLTVITTDVTGTQIGGGAMMGTGPAEDIPHSRMIASVIETPAGNWFVKVVGPEKTVTAHEQNIRNFVKRARLKQATG
ncbi:hypothetical protein KKH27_10725 [bacterium]|nr:hypothetical protein [bacterium]MBU1982943.1 hypothetical protein [bacterium]